MKFYAVKKGKNPGIYNTWDECKKQVHDFSGSEYKSFKSKAEAESYILGDITNDDVVNSTNTVIKESENGNNMIAYVDGSYNNTTREFSYGIVLFYNGEEQHISQKVNDGKLAEMRNVAGEIKGAEAAMKFAVSHGCSKLVIYHDYEGIAKWCTGEWKANKEGTNAYQQYYNSICEIIKVEFVKVQGHSNNKYNDMADELAKKAIFSEEQKKEVYQGDEEAKKLYLVRDLSKLSEVFNDIGKQLWEDYTSGEIMKVGNQHRLTFTTSDRQCMLDIYENNDGTTTLFPSGKNQELSIKLSEEVEKRSYKYTTESKAFTVFIGKDWFDKTVEFLKSICGVKIELDKSHNRYKFISSLGDKLTLTVYSDYKVLIQGKPLFLYNEFISFIANSPKVTFNDLINVTNEFVNTNIKVDDARARLAELMPNAYSSDIDDVVWKLFSPAVILIEGNRRLEDYSCCVFPVLRALEGYIKYLLFEKEIYMDTKTNFGSIFRPKEPSSTISVLLEKYKESINDEKYVSVLEEIYNYFKSNRHVIFHVNQILIDTKMIENINDAKTTVYEVAELIERTYTEISK